MILMEQKSHPVFKDFLLNIMVPKSEITLYLVLNSDLSCHTKCLDLLKDGPTVCYG